jgi:hypothetical protein
MNTFAAAFLVRRGDYVKNMRDLRLNSRRCQECLPIEWDVIWFCRWYKSFGNILCLVPEGRGDASLSKMEMAGLF